MIKHEEHLHNIYIYTCVCVCICVYMYIYLYIYIYIYIYIYVCVYIYMFISISISLSLSLSIYIYIYIYILVNFILAVFVVCFCVDFILFLANSISTQYFQQFDTFCIIRITQNSVIWFGLQTDWLTSAWNAECRENKIW